MRKLRYLFILLFITLISCKTNKQPTTESGKYQLIEIPSPSLAKALINPKQTQKVGIYLPPSYQTSNKSYPVVYNLTGFTVHPGEFPPMPWIDSLMVNKHIDEMIFVEISGYNLFQGTMYANSPVTGNWEDFVTQDVIHYIDYNYRTIPQRKARGIAGHSMGGGGCFNISLKHADKYAVAYPMSPALSANEAMMNLMFETDSTMMLLEKIGAELENVNDSEFENKLRKVIDTTNLNMLWLLGTGSAFAYDMDKTLRFAFPFDTNNEGMYVKNTEIWNKWNYGLGNIDEKIEKHKENLLQYRHYSMDCGYYDDILWLKDGTEFAIQAFHKNNIPISSHWYNGDHVNKVKEQMVNRLMPIMSAYLIKEE